MDARYNSPHNQKVGVLMRGLFFLCIFLLCVGATPSQAEVFDHKGWQITLPEGKSNSLIKESIQKAIDIVSEAPEALKADAQRIRDIRYEPVQPGASEFERKYFNVIGDYIPAGGDTPSEYIRLMTNPAFILPQDYAASILQAGYKARRFAEFEAAIKTHSAKPSAELKAKIELYSSVFLGKKTDINKHIRCDFMRNDAASNIAARASHRRVEDIQSQMKKLGCQGIPEYTIDKSKQSPARSVKEQYGYCFGFYEGKMFDKALPCLEQISLHGSAEAKNLLGNMYNMGWGVSLDKTKASKYWQAAAASGVHAAQYNLGMAYFQGIGIEQNYVKALEWLQKASARPGYYWPQYWIGVIYENGLGVDKNIDEAINWYEISSSNGSGESSRRLKVLRQSTVSP
ncbi:MAG: sel1 repeat family protein [Alphaproteobacteria bacterium]|nr:sel1 repeat family protein [Alphaproteobacteria bacterium]